MECVDYCHKESIITDGKRGRGEGEERVRGCISFSKEEEEREPVIIFISFTCNYRVFFST